MTPEQATQLILLLNRIIMLLEFGIGLMLVYISYKFISHIYKWFVGFLIGNI